MQINVNQRKVFARELLLNLAKSNRAKVEKVFNEIMQIAEKEGLFAMPQPTYVGTPYEVEIEDEE